MTNVIIQSRVEAAKEQFLFVFNVNAIIFGFFKAFLPQVSEQTTHLIGGKKGTAKYQDAQKQENIKFVSIDWLMTCSDRWEKVQEGLFPIPKKRSNTSGSNSREGTPPVSKRKLKGGEHVLLNIVLQEEFGSGMDVKQLLY